MKELTIDDLRIVKEFQLVPDEQLQWLISQGETFELEEGDFLFKAGDPIVFTYIVLDGKMRIATMQSGKQKELLILDPGQLTGYLPYSRVIVAPVFCEVIKKTWLFQCAKEKLIEGFGIHFSLIESLVHIMLNRVRGFTSLQQQNEKMFSLGKLSAGLAHELNNPAAAISRAASMLQTQVGQFPKLFKHITHLKIRPEKVDMINNLIIHKTRTEPPVLSMLKKASLEDELRDWLDDHGLRDIDPEGFVERGFTAAELDVLKDCTAPEHLPVLMEWVGNYLVTHKMAEDIHASSERISELIGAVKNFTFMDKDANRQLTNIHSGIRNTLKMLNYKVRKGNVTVVEHYDDTLPQIKALPGELNQVWTNIIDNAIDAMEINGKGQLVITTSHDARIVRISIKDDGPGIPEDIKKYIFTPFFTTKEMGKGSGLGLDVVTRIMTLHNGEVSVKSEPGATEFEICIPI